jgi:hypothetical protein
MTEASQGNQPLQWKLFIRRRASATQGTPPGKDELKWVANTTTMALIKAWRLAFMMQPTTDQPKAARIVLDRFCPWAG